VAYVVLLGCLSCWFSWTANERCLSCIHSSIRDWLFTRLSSVTNAPILVEQCILLSNRHFYSQSLINDTRTWGLQFFTAVMVAPLVAWLEIQGVQFQILIICAIQIYLVPVPSSFRAILYYNYVHCVHLPCIYHNLSPDLSMSSKKTTY
jgi:hypothetical protein